MPAGRTNKFAKARQHLRSTHLDEKIQMLNEIPTNNTTTFFVTEPDVFETIPAVTAPLDLEADDAALLGKDTSGLFDGLGNSLAAAPPGDTSYILGPMVSVYFPDGDYSAIGYIQQDTRKVVNLARIPGTVSEWGIGGNVEGFTSYSQLTLEQALWYRDQLINGNTSDYRVFYIGVFEQINSENPNRDVTDPSAGVDIDEFGRWLGDIINSGYEIEPARQELIKKGKTGPDPEMPPGIANPLLSGLVGQIGNVMVDVVSGAIPIAGAIRNLLNLKKNVPALDYSVDIAISVLQNKPVKYDQSDLNPEHIDALINNLNPDDIGKNIKINSEPEPYADDNFITDEDGNVRPRNQYPTKSDGSIYTADEIMNDPDLLSQANAWANDNENHPNNTSQMSQNDPGFLGTGNPLHVAGNAQGQIVVPKDGSEPYFKYEDHAYVNSAEMGGGEVPDPIKQAISTTVHQVAGHSTPVEPGTKGQETQVDTTTPNTGEMSGYPSNIRGDVIKTFKVPFSKLPSDIQSAVQSQLGESVRNLIRQKKILREIKKPYVVPEIVQEKVKYRPKVNKTGIKSVGDGLMKKAEVPTSFKRIEDTMWKKQDRHWNERHSQERKNMILDAVGTSDHAWEYITDRSASDNESRVYENFGQGIKNRIIDKKKIGNDYIIKMYNEEGKVETVTQSILNERLQKQYELTEQETIYAPKDPLVARIRNKFYSQIDYPDKPAKLGYPNEPTPQMIGGYHPEFGDRHAYYNRLDRHSADTMQNAPTQDPKIDMKVQKQTTRQKALKIINDVRTSRARYSKATKKNK